MQPISLLARLDHFAVSGNTKADIWTHTMPYKRATPGMGHLEAGLTVVPPSMGNRVTVRCLRSFIRLIPRQN